MPACRLCMDVAAFPFLWLEGELPQVDHPDCGPLSEEDIRRYKRGETPLRVRARYLWPEEYLEYLATGKYPDRYGDAD